MTVEQLVTDVQLELDSIENVETPDYYPEDYLYFLNKAAERLFKRRYKEFETGAKRWEDLQSFVKSFNVQVGNINDEGTWNGFKLYSISLEDLDSSYFSLVRSSSHLKKYKKDCDKTIRRVVNTYLIQHDDLNSKIDDPFAKPDNRNVLGLIRGNKLFIISKDFEVEEVDGQYLKYPSQVTLNDVSEFPDHMNSELISETVAIMLERMGHPTYQTYVQQQTLND